MGDPKYISDVESDPFVFPENLIPGSGGAKLTKLPAELTVKFTEGNEVPVDTIQLADRRTNVVEIRIELISLKDTLIKTINSDSPVEPIKLGTNQPLKAIKITILKTKNGRRPNFVEISIRSCLPTTTPNTRASSTVFSTSTHHGNYRRLLKSKSKRNPNF